MTKPKTLDQLRAEKERAETQLAQEKHMLEDYAIKHGFTNLVHFTDDGWSGATFDRPSWNRLAIFVLKMTGAFFVSGKESHECI